MQIQQIDLRSLGRLWSEMQRANQAKVEWLKSTQRKEYRLRPLQITLTLSHLFLVAFASQAAVQDYTQLNLPEGVIARFGENRITGNIQYSPDGKFLAVPSSIGISLYDMVTHQEVTQLVGHTSQVNSVAFSPDGRTLASGSQDNTIRLWDAVTGDHRRTLIGHTSFIPSVAFSPDGNTLASAGGSDDTIRLWDVATGTHKRTLTGHTSRVWCVAFSPDGRTLASGGWDNTILLWDTVTGAHKRTLIGHTFNVFSVEFSPDGKTLVSGGRDSTIRLWDVATGEHNRTLTAHTSPVPSVMFSPDGKTLASGSWDETIRLWDVATGAHKRSLTGHSSDVRSVAFSPDGRTLASGSDDGTVFLWELPPLTSINEVDPTIQLSLPEGAIARFDKSRITGNIEYSPGGTRLAIPNPIGISLYDTATHQEVTQLVGHTSQVNSVAFSPDGRTLASGSQDNTIRLWDAVTGDHRRTLIGHTSFIPSVVFSPDGKTLATAGGDDDTIRLWDVATGTHKRTLTGHTSRVRTVAFSPDGKTLASGGWDNTIRLWDAVTGAHKQILIGHTHDLRSVAFSPDGTTLVSGGRDSTVRLWDAVTGAHKQTLTEHTGDVRSAVFSPDGRTLASGGRDSTVRLWDAVTGAHKQTLTGHTSVVISVVFSPDGKTLASASENGTVFLWEFSPSINVNEFDLYVPASTSLIHVPLKVTAVNGAAKALESIADVYDVLGGAATVNLLITYDSQIQEWRSYFGPQDRSKPADKLLVEDLGIIAFMKAPTSVRLSGIPLGTSGRSALTLNQGLNLVGLPLRDSRLARVSDLFVLKEIGGNVPVIILTDKGEFKSVGRVGDAGDIPITGGQSFILNAREPAMIAISGDGWHNISEVTTTPLLAPSIGVKETTPVLALRGSIINEKAEFNKGAFRITVENLSTGRVVTTVPEDEGVIYQLTIVDIKTTQAARVGDILAVSAQSPDPLIEVQPLQYTVTTEDIKWGRIQLPVLVAYKIPAETSTLSDNFCNFYVVMLSLDSNLFIGSDTIDSHGMEYPMRVQKYKVVLSAKQRKRLKALSQRGQVSARKLARAHILLLADQNRPQGVMNDNQIHQILNVSQATVIRVRKKFATCGLEAAIEELSRCGRPLTFDGYQRAQVTALACSTPPEGQSQWSLRLLADQLVELGVVEAISHETVGVILKKTN